MIKGILKSSPLLVMAFMIIMTSVVRAATEYEIRSLCPDSRVVVEIENENRGLTSQNLWVFACNSLELNAAKKINQKEPIIGTCLPGVGSSEYSFCIYKTESTLSSYRTQAIAYIHRFEWESGANTSDKMEIFRITDDKVIIPDIVEQSMMGLLQIAHVDSSDLLTHKTTIHITVTILPEPPRFRSHSF